MAGSAVPVALRLARTGRVALRACAVAGITAVLAAPLAADTASGPALDAALAACAAPGLTLSERVAGLTDAGWRQATPSDAARDRAALQQVAEPLLQGRPLQGFGLGSPADQFLRARERRSPVMPSPGAPMTAAAILQVVAASGTVWAGELDRAGLDGTLALVVSPQRGTPDAAEVTCSFVLGTPEPADVLDALVPADTAPGTDDRGGGTPAATLRRLVISLGDGATLRLTHADLTTASDFTALMAEVGPVAPLSTLITVGMTDVPLR